MCRAMSEMNKDELFNALATDPVAWVSESAGQMRSAYMLWTVSQERFDHKMQLGSHTVNAEELLDMRTDRYLQCYMLLAGLAAENLAKALLVSRMLPNAGAGSLPKKLQSHSLRTLLQRAEVTLTKAESLLVERLEESVVWKGRYPTPINSGGIPSAFPADAFARFSHHPKEVTAFLCRITALLPDSIGQPIDWVAKECPRSKRQ